MTCEDHTRLYRDASFKGVPFLIGTSSDEFGRRGVDWEFPFGEVGQELDLGRRTRRFSLMGYVRGADHVAKALAIIAAVETPGPGLLIHPYLGAVTASCRSLRVDNDRENAQRETRLQFEFVEASGLVMPAIIGLAGSALGVAGEALGVAMTALVSGLSLVQLTATERQDADAMGSRLLAGSAQALRMSTAWADEAVDAYDKAVAAIEGGTVLVDGGRFVATMTAVVDAIGATARSDAEARRAFGFLSAGTQITIPKGGAGSNLQNGAVVATRAILGRAWAGLAAEGEYSNADTLWRDFKGAFDLLDGEAGLVAQMSDDVAYRAVTEYQSIMADVALARLVRLPGMVLRQMDKSFPSLVLAHRLYGDARRAEEIERANPLSWPAAMARDVVTLAG